MSNAQAKLEQAVAHMVGGVVSRPEEVEIIATRNGQGPVFMVRVNPRDVGRLIGRQGRTIQAMRDLLGASAQALGTAAATIEIDESEQR